MAYMSENKKETIGSRIILARKEKKLTQDELADIVGVSRAAISQWEHNVPSDMKSKHIDKLCEALGRSKEWILDGQEIAAAHKKISNNTESTYLARVTMTELALLTYYRSANEIGQKSIIASVKGIAEQSPSESKTYNFRRKEDL